MPTAGACRLWEGTFPICVVQLMASQAIRELDKRQYLGFVLTRAGNQDNAGDSEGEKSEESQGSTADAAEPSLSSSKEVDHV